jgi:hypothetical protein
VARNRQMIACFWDGLPADMKFFLKKRKKKKRSQKLGIFLAK